MRFLANENFPWPCIILLKENGWSIKSILEENGGISDEEVIRIVQSEDLVILTFDSDYGEILFKYGINNPPSVIYFRFKGKSPNEAGELLIKLLKTGIQFEGYFTVIEATTFRQRKL